MTATVRDLWRNEGGGFGVERSPIPAPRCYLCAAVASFNEQTHRWLFRKHCRACRQEHRNRRQRTWRLRNRDREREYALRYRERVRDYGRSYRETHKAACRAHARKWQRANRGYFKAWKYDHPEQWAAYMAKAQAKRRRNAA